MAQTTTKVLHRLPQQSSLSTNDCLHGASNGVSREYRDARLGRRDGQTKQQERAKRKGKKKRAKIEATVTSSLGGAMAQKNNKKKKKKRETIEGTVTGASGGAIRRPCERMPIQFVSLLPWNRSWRLWLSLCFA
jgi:hypothetical protein